MSGELPRTQHGTPSYARAEDLLTARLDELARTAMTEYGLTKLEVAKILSDSSCRWVMYATKEQQRGSKDRKGVLGTPREEERLPRGKAAAS